MHDAYRTVLAAVPPLQEAVAVLLYLEDIDPATLIAEQCDVVTLIGGVQVSTPSLLGSLDSPAELHALALAAAKDQALEALGTLATLAAGCLDELTPGGSQPDLAEQQAEIERQLEVPPGTVSNE